MKAILLVWILGIGILLLLFIFPKDSGAALIKPLSSGFNCDVDGICGYPLGDYNINENVNFDHWSAWAGKYEEGMLCDIKRPLYLQIKLGDNWYNASSTSWVSIVSGVNPQNVRCQSISPNCDASSGYRAYWQLKAKIGSECGTYQMRVYTSGWNPSDDFLVIVNGNCEVPEMDYNPFLLIFKWILGMFLGVRIALLFKKE